MGLGRKEGRTTSSLEVLWLPRRSWAARLTSTRSCSAKAMDLQGTAREAGVCFWDYSGGRMALFLR